MGGRKPRTALVVEREPRVQDRTTDPGGVMSRAASVGLCAGTSNRIRPISRVVDLGARAVCWRPEARRTHRSFMGRIVTSVIVENVPATRTVRIDALVETGAGYLTLPMAWKERFGTFALEEEVALQTATQQVVSGTVCGPALGPYRRVQGDSRRGSVRRDGTGRGRVRAFAWLHSAQAVRCGR